MQKVLTVRKKLGISQQDMADYLMVSRSLLSLVEMGMRDLPTKALIKLSKFESGNKPFVSPPAQKINDPGTARLQAAVKKKLQQRARTCSFHATKVKRQLATLYRQDQQNTTLMKIIQHLFSQLPAGREGAQDKLWLELQQEAVLKKMQHSGETAQALLQLKIDLLEFEAKRLHDLL